MNDETLRRLTQEHLRERMGEAERERLARRLRNPRAHRSARRSFAPLLGHLLAVRRHAAP